MLSSVDDTRLNTIVEAVLRELQSRAPEGSNPPAAAPARSGPAGARRTVSTSLQVAVLGAGHGGLAMAGHLALLGVPVRLFSFFERELEPVAQRGGVEVQGKEVSGFGRLEVVRTLDKAVQGADLIMIVSPAYTHATYAALLSGLLSDGQVVVLNPGRTGGALEFARVLRRYALRRRIYLAEAQTFIYASELRGPGKVEILKEKNRMRVAALPASDNGHVIPLLQQIYPQIEAAQNVLETSVNNVGGVNHPAVMLLNTATIERAARGEDLRFYRDMINPSICNLVMEKLDREKVAIGEKLGLDTWTTMYWYQESYGVTGNSLYEVYQNNHYYLGFHAPTHILGQNNILDEIPNSLVPLSLLARQLGLRAPTMESLIELASVMCEIDFWAEGRTMEKLGLAGLSPEEMLERVERQPLLGACQESGVCRVFPQYA